VKAPPPAAPGEVVLALDASTSTGSVAVGDGDRLLAEAVLNVGPGASSSLLPAADAVLRMAGLGPADVTAVVVAGGPGSFTGLRIAAATAKGIAAARRVPLLAYSGLMAAAAVHGGAGRTVCALFDARRRDVYAAAYRFGAASVEEVMAPAAMTVDEVAARLRELGEAPLFTGDAAALHGAELAGATGGAVAPPLLAGPRGAALLWLARVAPAAGAVADAASWEPEYLRASGAERIAAAAAAEGAP
jgi:tRNA threonylcarbamoyladenosine biosynthesis protein TsaB